MAETPHNAVALLLIEGDDDLRRVAAAWTLTQDREKISWLTDLDPDEVSESIDRLRTLKLISAHGELSAEMRSYLHRKTAQLLRR